MGSQLRFTASVDERSNYVVLDERVIQRDEHRYWLYSGDNPETNDILHIRLYSTITAALIEQFLRGLTEKHDRNDAAFLVDGAHVFVLHSVDLDSDFDTKNMELGTLLNIFSTRYNSAHILYQTISVAQKSSVR